MNQPERRRVSIAALPTPITNLPRLSEQLGGPEIWVKRDDLTGLAGGGNKTRKLEFLIADAQAQGARTIITRGSAQSNHCRQTAAAAAQLGFECILVLNGSPDTYVTGNLLFDHLLGAEIVWAREGDEDEVFESTIQRAQEAGRKPYRVPYGGSNPLGASAYVAAMGEFQAQNCPMHRILFATSSGGTQAGMVVGGRIHGFTGQILGISVHRSASTMCEHVAELATQIAAELGEDLTFQPDEIVVNDQYIGQGYGLMGEPEIQAIRTFARTEGLLLDPVYTGKAAAGMIDLIQRGLIDSQERILFWHTGGTPALHAYSADLVDK